MSVNEKMTALANAIRSKTGKTGKLSLDNMAQEIENLKVEELIQLADIPNYVKKEALRVATAVQEKLNEYGEGSVVFISLSDTHLNNDSATGTGYIAPRDALMAAKILAYALNIDFVIHTGDVTAGRSTDTPDTLKAQATTVINMMKEAFKGFPIFCAIGNHDSGEYYDNANGQVGTYMTDGDFLYNNFTALCNPDQYVSTNGGYCYKDFPDKNLRVFLLNSSESLVGRKKWPTEGAERWQAMSNAQLNQFGTWLNNMPTNYQCILVSHYPADFGANMCLSTKILNFIDAENSEGKLIAQFHGHLHNLLTSRLHDYNENEYKVYRIGTPSVEAGRENSYANISFDNQPNLYWGDPYPTQLTKTPDSRESTSFVVNIISPDRSIINSICYGAGYDRTITLRAETHSVMYNLANATISNAARYVEKGQTYETQLVFDDGYLYKYVTIKYNGEDITSSAYNATTGVIKIENVNGNIEIIANGAKYKNILPEATDTDGTIYNNVGYAIGRLNGDGTLATSSYEYYCVTGFIPCKTNDTLYFANVNSNNSDSYCRISLYNSNKEHIVTINGNQSQPANMSKNYNDSGIITDAKIIKAGVAFVRVVGKGVTGINETSIITINEPIE